MRIIKIIVSYLILTTFFVGALEGQSSWYLSQVSGVDTNTGQNPASPFKTIDHAIAFLNPADTLFLMGEFQNSSYNPDYQFSNNINDPHIWTQENSIRISNLHGSPEQFITIKSYDENTILKGDGANIFRMLNSSYIRIEGLEIFGEVENIPIETALALQFLYRENNSINTLYRVPPGTSDEQVGQMTFDILDNVSRPSYTDTRGIFLTNVHHIDLLNNLVHHTPGNGFRVSDCDYINIVGNEVHNCSRKSYSGTHGLVVTNANSFDNETGYKIFILRNKVHHNFNEIYSWAPSKDFINPIIDEGKGISMQRNDLESGWTHGRFLIANNLAFWNGYSGVHSNAGIRMDFINNTCFMNSYTNTITYADEEQTGNNIGLSTSTGHDIRILNNISFIDASWNGFPISSRNTTEVEVANNLVFGINGPLSFDPDLEGIEENTIEGDPFFEDGDNFNFQLLENSPAIGMADVAVAPETDFFENIRIGNPDIGAIESDFVLGVLDDLKIENLKVFPNPFFDKITIKGIKLRSEEVAVFNFLGQSFSHLIRIKIGEQTTIDTSSLPNGNYIFKIKNGSKILYKN